MQIAHFEPVPVAIAGEGVFPAVVLTLPREENAAFDAALRSAREQHERAPAGHRCLGSTCSWVLYKYAWLTIPRLEARSVLESLRWGQTRFSRGSS